MRHEILKWKLELLLQELFRQRKNALYRRAAELSSLCGAKVAIITISAKGELSQFSSDSMEYILKEFGKKCTKSHEMQTMESIQNHLEDERMESHMGTRKRSRLRISSLPDNDYSHKKGSKKKHKVSGQNIDRPKARKPHLVDIERELSKLAEERAKRAKKPETQSAARTSTSSDGTISNVSDAPQKLEVNFDAYNADIKGEKDTDTAPKYFASIQAALAGDISPSKTNGTATRIPQSKNDQVESASNTGFSSPNKQSIMVTNVQTPSAITVPPVQGSAPAVPLLEAARSLENNDNKN